MQHSDFKLYKNTFTNSELRELCIEFAKCEDENDLLNILKAKNLLNEDNWTPYGNDENNYSTIGNQQEAPEVALVEKFVNCIDHLLILKCLQNNIDPKSDDAPQSMYEAVEKFFNINKGEIIEASPSKRTEIAENIKFIATGKKDSPCYIISDLGEGQHPHDFEKTFLSLNSGNKADINFVQGKWNQGSTGVLSFAGEENFQLIISKKNPLISDDNAKWGFTLVKRFTPEGNKGISVYKFLKIDNKIPSFEADSLKILPGKYPEPYENNLKYGTFVKLYNYKAKGLKSPIVFDLYNRVSLLLHSIALPIRFYERRLGYNANSYETNLTGLSVRVNQDRNDNLEEGYPSSAKINIDSSSLNLNLYVFKKGKMKKYSNNQGIIFTVNGQTHGHLSKQFFERSSIGLGYLKDSILIELDCSNLHSRKRELLFMNSRDRLRDGEAKEKIESAVTDLVKNHEGLKKLQDERRKSLIQDKLDSQEDINHIISNLIKKDRDFEKLLLLNSNIKNPFSVINKTDDKKTELYLHPKFFKLEKNFNYDKPKNTPINRDTRVRFITNVVNDYLTRFRDPGEIKIFINGKEQLDFSINLYNGVANLTLPHPKEFKEDDVFKVLVELHDINQPEPFTNTFYVKLTQEVEKTTNNSNRNRTSVKKKGNKKINPSEGGLSIPNIQSVTRAEWEEHEFDEKSAMRIVKNGENYDYFINIDNIYFLNECKKNNKEPLEAIKFKFIYGNYLLAISLTKNISNFENSKLSEEDLVRQVTSSSAPVIIPMIDHLSQISV